MITGELKNKVDKVWETFWTGGITNPLTVIEQFTYLLYIKGLDDNEKKKEMDAIQNVRYCRWTVTKFIFGVFIHFEVFVNTNAPFSLCNIRHNLCI